MENQQVIDNSISDFSNQLNLTEEAKSFLNETRKWTKFLSIVGFVFAGLLVVLGLFFGTIINRLTGGMNIPSAMPMAAVGIVYIIIAVIYAIPIFYLYKFSTNMDSALKTNNVEDLTQSFSYLKSHYKFFGIVTILMVALYGVIIIFGVIAAAAFS
jgi:Family of unknown function (DUF5362)